MKICVAQAYLLVPLYRRRPLPARWVELSTDVEAWIVGFKPRPKYGFLRNAFSLTMALPSGPELLFIVVVLGLLFILSRKGSQSRVGMNILFLLVIGVLIFALFYLTRLVLTLFRISLLLAVTMVLIMAVFFFRLIRR